MAKRQSKKSKMGIIVAVLLLAVGFAAVTTTLYINGTIRIVPDVDDFEDNVVFTSAKLTYTDTAKTASDEVTYSAAAGASTDSTSQVQIVDDGKKVVFTTSDLKTIGEKATLTYEVSNLSQYNAQFDNPAVVCVIKKDGSAYTVDATHPEYITVDSTAALLDGQILVSKTGKATGNELVVTQVRSYAGETGVTSQPERMTFDVECTIGATATDATA